MAVYAYFSHGGVDYYTYVSMKLTKRISDTYASSTFTITLDNISGKYSDTFTKSSEIIIYADKDVKPPTTKLFSGMVRDIIFSGKPNSETLTLSGVGFVDGVLMDSMVEPEVYNSTEVSLIAIDAFDKYTTGGITRTGITTTSTTITRIRFANISMNEVLQQLAEMSGFYSYGDADKNLHFEQKATVSSGLLFDNTNIISSSRFKNKRSDYFNELWVFGGKMLTEIQHPTFTANGGSVVSLSYKPHNTFVTVSGVASQGGIFQMSSVPQSGQQYLVDFEGKRIIFTSGTAAGYNIPVSGTDPVAIRYAKENLIAKYGVDRAAIAGNNNIRVGKTIVDKNITDPRQAEDIVISQLALGTQAQNEGVFMVDGVFSVTPGQTCIVNLPYQNVDNATFVIMEAVYDFTPSKMLSDTVLSLKVNTKTRDIVDVMKQMIIDLKKLQAADLNDTDIISRLETATGSAGFRVNPWRVRTWDIGSNFLLSHDVNGIMWDGSGAMSYLVGSPFVQTFTMIASGGYV